MELHLIRHTAVAAAGLCYGHHDVPLADTFAAEAAQLRAKLPESAPGWRVLSSPAARCRRLAAALWPAPATVTEDARLRELHFSSWENRPWAELPPDELNPWMADFVALAPPGGESFAELHARTPGRTGGAGGACRRGAQPALPRAGPAPGAGVSAQHRLCIVVGPAPPAGTLGSALREPLERVALWLRMK